MKAAKDTLNLNIWANETILKVQKKSLQIKEGHSEDVDLALQRSGLWLPAN